MSALEYEIIEKFHQLDKDAKKRVRELIDQEIDSAGQAFDYDAWFHDVETLRQEIHAGHGAPIDVVGLLRDIRDGEDE